MALAGSKQERGRLGTERRRPFRSGNERLVEGVRWRMSRDSGALARLRRLERLERVARVWVNGAEVGPGRHGHLAESYD
jgi:hypothetical protein